MDRKLIWVCIGSLFLIVLATVATILFTQPAGFRGTSYTEPFPHAPDIELKQANGQLFQLSGQKGKIVLLFFGYTFCPDVCPATMAELKLVMEDLGGKANAVQVVFISVDPGRDTPEKVQEYVNHFHSSFIGLSGSQTELEKIWKEYGIFREIVPGSSSSDYSVNHTARITLLDTDGNLRLSYAVQTPVDDIVHDIKLLLK